MCAAARGARQTLRGRAHLVAEGREEVHEGAVADGHALGAAGAAGGEDAVGDVVGAARRQVRLRRRAAALRHVVVEVDDAGVVREERDELRRQVGGGDEGARRGVLHHVCAPLRRVQRVEGDVDGAHLEDGEQRRHEVGAPAASSA